MAINRVFLSLYLLLVLSILVVGWSVDRVWQAYNPQPDTNIFEPAFFALADARLDALDHPSALAEIARWNLESTLQFELLPLDALAKSTLAEQIHAGKTVTTIDENGRPTYYHRIADSHQVLRATGAQTSAEANIFYLLLLMAFYLLIGLVVFFWVWPLSQDLRRLESQAQYVGSTGMPAPVSVGVGSPVYPVATAFNAMAERINGLLASHREMTSAVSHELRTPLARMKFALAMVESNVSDTQRSQKLASLTTDVAEMEKLIGDLLNFAGYEHSQQPLHQQPGDLPALVTSLLNRQAPTPRVAIVEQLNGQSVYCEWRLMETCLHNLIQNAYKYARKQVRITLAVDAKHYRVRVEDDGMGIPANEQQRVFEPFVRLRGATGDTSGFGLGLAIVRRIALWHGGAVRATESPLGGACFELTWPCNDATQGSP